MFPLCHMGVASCSLPEEGAETENYVSDGASVL